MKERPILFSAPMVRALLDGSKTQTRRPYKVRKNPDAGCEMAASELVREPQHVVDRICPYGQPGDRLWVRESGVRSLLAGSGEQSGLFRHDVPETPELGRYWVERTREHGASYAAAGCTRKSALLSLGAKATPSIHMPRWASRILLEIVAVRVERLNDCSEADAIAEGCEKNHNGYYWGGPHAVSGRKQMSTAQKAYCDLWESINGAGSWAANPWVWVVEFNRVAP